ncbi:hypothetical protein [Streptomyces goshikiensis]|uniref:hypothetical protein n=1 Tax=Streptomyces goshikiensis TaxID=1942 RepID=UPI003682B2B8
MSPLGIARHRGRHRRLSSSAITALYRQKDAATVAAIKYATEVTELQQQLDTAGITISGLLLDAEEAQREITRLTAALANATTVRIAAGVRDIAPDDEPTHPIDVRKIRAEHAADAANPAVYVPMRLAAVEAGRL